MTSDCEYYSVGKPGMTNDLLLTRGEEQNDISSRKSPTANWPWIEGHHFSWPQDPFILAGYHHYMASLHDCPGERKLPVACTFFCLFLAPGYNVSADGA